jgi:uncharacterized protein YerC
MKLSQSPDLFGLFAALETSDECRSFLVEVLSPNELRDVMTRWEILLLLAQGLTYQDIKEPHKYIELTNKPRVELLTLLKHIVSDCREHPRLCFAVLWTDACYRQYAPVHNRWCGLGNSYSLTTRRQERVAYTIDRFS